MPDTPRPPGADEDRHHRQQPNDHQTVRQRHGVLWRGVHRHIGVLRVTSVLKIS